MNSKTLHLDDRIASYRSFLDYGWVQAIEKQTHGTVLDEPLMSLIFSWKATANAFTMPFLMMHFLKNFEAGYCRSQESTSEKAAKVLAEHLPERMAQKHGLSHMKKKQLADASMMMFLFPAVKLHHQLAGMDKALVVRPAVCALATEQALIPRLLHRVARPSSPKQRSYKSTSRASGSGRCQGESAANRR